MGVLGIPALGRHDIAIGIGQHQSLGFRWWRSDGVAKTAVDLTGYTGTAVLHADDAAGRVWATLTPVLSADGLCQLVVAPAVTSGPAWAGRTNGAYRITLTSPVGTVTRLVHGYLYISH